MSRVKHTIYTEEFEFDYSSNELSSFMTAGPRGYKVTFNDEEYPIGWSFTNEASHPSIHERDLFLLLKIVWKKIDGLIEDSKEKKKS